MIQLVYISKASTRMCDRDIEAICEQGRRNNLRDEITGVLVERAGRFLQVLEGPQAATEDAFLRIILDPRHYDLTLLSRRMSTSRLFGPWAMRHCNSQKDCEAVAEKVVPLIVAAPAWIQKEFNEFLSHKRIDAAGQFSCKQKRSAHG